MRNKSFYESYYLIPGEISELHFNLLFEISSARSEKVRTALHDYFVYGLSRKDTCKKHNVTQGCLSVKIREFQALSEKVFELHSFYVK